jgi:glycosyltransferase involved in cell wall biosynthesis
MEPLVSVIIPTYNRADYLKLALKSVLEQTYKNIEVIVADDGSMDNTAEVVADFNDPRVKYFYQRNTGLPAVTRNRGLREASGEYVAFLDSDDMWQPEKLEIQVEYLRNQPDYHLAYSNAWIIDETDARKGLIMDLELFKEGEIFKYLVKYNFIPQLTVLMKRKVFDEIGFFNEDPTLRAVEDYEYWLRVALRHKIGFVKEPLAMYRVHSGGMSRAANLAPAQQKILFSLLEDPSVPNKNKIEERVYELYYPSAMYNWTNSANVTAKKELRKYLSYNLRHANLTNVFKALRFGVLFNFKYNNLKRIKNWILNQRS